MIITDCPCYPKTMSIFPQLSGYDGPLRCSYLNVYHNSMHYARKKFRAGYKCYNILLMCSLKKLFIYL